MAPRCGVRASAWILAWVVGCSARGAQPTLLLQLSLIAHGRAQDEVRQRREELVLSASVALPFEPGARAPPLAAIPELTPFAPDCEPGSDPLCDWAELAEHVAFEDALSSLP